jgi:hypothetical protein
LLINHGADFRFGVLSGRVIEDAGEAVEREYWARLYGRWEALDPAGVAAVLEGFGRPWWVVGGWAIDAFTGVPREHQDVDVSILACDVPALREQVRGRWDLWNLAGGDMRPLTDQHPDVFHPASQIWVREHGDAPWLIDLPLTPDRDGLWTNKFLPEHTAEIDEVTWVADNRIRYLNPEIVLFFKARKQRTKDTHDLTQTWPTLTTPQQTWLHKTLHKTNPHHPWLPHLT